MAGVDALIYDRFSLEQQGEAATTAASRVKLQIFRQYSLKRQSLHHTVYPNAASLVVRQSHSKSILKNQPRERTQECRRIQAVASTGVYVYIIHRAITIDNLHTTSLQILDIGLYLQLRPSRRAMAQIS
jgi:hypothetical protein